MVALGVIAFGAGGPVQAAESDSGVPGVTEADANVTGTVSSTNGAVASGYVEFYASCEDWNTGNDAGYASFYDSQPYQVTVPPGDYRVRISPDSGYGCSEVVA
ncbi:MAG: hypothetical protein V9E98_14975 [Candidatus Nanopelagicales bacterium]